MSINVIRRRFAVLFLGLAVSCSPGPPVPSVQRPDYGYGWESMGGFSRYEVPTGWIVKWHGYRAGLTFVPDPDKLWALKATGLVNLPGGGDVLPGDDK